MAEQGAYELTERLQRTRLERARELEALVEHLRGLEQELLDVSEGLRRIELDASKPPADAEEVPARPARVEPLSEDPPANGAAVVAARLAREGHSREDVRAFLEENFEKINAAATVKKVFA